MKIQDQMTEIVQAVCEDMRRLNEKKAEQWTPSEVLQVRLYVVITNMLYECVVSKRGDVLAMKNHATALKSITESILAEGLAEKLYAQSTH
jgi:hypothetical protein